MIGILIIKGLLIAFSIITIGILPLVALFNMWIWNSIIIKYVINCGREVTSYWIMLGITACGFGITGIIAPLSAWFKK
jgi:hypothetical protein